MATPKPPVPRPPAPPPPGPPPPPAAIARPAAPQAAPQRPEPAKPPEAAKPLPPPVVRDAAETTPATPEQAAAASDAEARMAALSADPTSQANAVTGLVGDSGSGKTSQVCEAIEYTWEVYRRIARVYHFDSGGFGNKLIRLAKLGIAQIWTPRNHIEPFETAEFASLGYWPEKILDPDTGYADPYVRLIAPQVQRWAVYCPNGHPVKTVDTLKLLDHFQHACPECRTLVTMQNWSKAEKEVVRSPGFKHVGLYIFDSVTAMSDWIMIDMAEKSARDEMGGGDRNALRGAPSKIVSGSMMFGSNSMPHYGFAQNRVASWLANMRRIPYQVVPPIATFLENRGSDDANIVVFGPKIAGTAKTAELPSMLGNCLNLGKVPTASGTMKHRIWLETHAHPNEGNIPHLAKTRGEPGDFPAYLEDKEGEPPFTTCSLKFFFRRMDEALKRSLARAGEQYRDAPALKPFTDDGQEDVLTRTPASVGVAAGPARPLPMPVAGMVPVGQAAPPPAAGVPRPPMPPTPPAAPVQQTVLASPLPAGAEPAVSPAAAQANLHLVPPPKTEEAPPTPPTAPAPTASSAAAAPATPPPTRAVSSRRATRPPIPSATEAK